MLRERFPWATALPVAGAVLLLDQATKAWVLREMPGAPPLTIIPGFFDVTFSRNTGGVFGLFAGPPGPARRILFAAATAVALTALALLLRRWGRESRLALVALSLVAGGAVGNLIDRLRFGSVVDFIDWYWGAHHWYTFNVADAAITSGAALLLLHSFLPERHGAGRDGQPAPTLPEA
ncbi:MAG TPA: signal peptidase II [Candidatus Methanoperedens sp.]|nr:signal peptidase II [Candidatus Methanoperedens sp.]